MIISTTNEPYRKRFGDREALRLIREAGFDGVDYSFIHTYKEGPDILNLPDRERGALADELRMYAQEIGLCFPQAHADYPYRHGDTHDAPVYRNIIRGMEFAAALGCRQIVIHSVIYPVEEAEHMDVLGENCEFLRSFLPYAEAYDIDIGVETLFLRDPRRDSFVGMQCRPEEMNALLDALGSPRFKICCDVGHTALCGTQPQDFIASMDPARMTMVHLQDTDYKNDRHWLPFVGKHDWDAITTELARIGFSGAINLEIGHYYRRFPPALTADVLRLAAKTARYLADLVETKMTAMGTAPMMGV